VARDEGVLWIQENASTGHAGAAPGTFDDDWWKLLNMLRPRSTDGTRLDDVVRRVECVGSGEHAGDEKRRHAGAVPGRQQQDTFGIRSS
jgi:hypothetical protein